MIEQVEAQLAPSPQRRPEPAAQSHTKRPKADGPPDSPTTDWAWYAYGVVGARVELGPLSGVDPSQSVRLVCEGELAAVVSQVALDDFGEERLREHLSDMGWVEMVARVHERVLDQIRAAATVIPMRMCTVYRTESGVRDMLRRESAALAEAIDHLVGKAEWGVKAFADVAHLASVVDDRDSESAQGDVGEARGAAYMRRKRDERDRQERARQLIEESSIQIHERLRSLATEGHVTTPQRPEVSGHAGDMVLNGVYLVSDDARERFHEEVRELEAEFGPHGIELELTGPWPAYNFVPGTIGAAW
jgi:hypothetical protein